jgi:hypothetical protein
VVGAGLPRSDVGVQPLGASGCIKRQHHNDAPSPLTALRGSCFVRLMLHRSDAKVLSRTLSAYYEAVGSADNARRKP